MEGKSLGAELGLGGPGGVDRHVIAMAKGDNGRLTTRAIVERIDERTRWMQEKLNNVDSRLCALELAALRREGSKGLITAVGRLIYAVLGGLAAVILALAGRAL